MNNQRFTVLVVIIALLSILDVRQDMRFAVDMIANMVFTMLVIEIAPSTFIMVNFWPRITVCFNVAVVRRNPKPSQIAGHVVG